MSYRDIRFKISSGFESINNTIDQIIVQGTFKDDKSNNHACGIIMDQQKYEALQGEYIRVKQDTCTHFPQRWGKDGKEVRLLFRALDFETI